MLDYDKFKKITDLVIAKLEGGYGHPHMFVDGTRKVNGVWVDRITDSRLFNSGETMFGVDRAPGGVPNPINKTPEGKEFWRLIDEQKAWKNWEHGYIPPDPLKTKLRDLAAKIIFINFKKNVDNFMDPDAQEIMMSDDRILFTFIYATWNGPGWFQRFANLFEDKIKTERNPDKLVDYLLWIRRNKGLRGDTPNSIIAQGAKIMEKFIQDLKSGVPGSGGGSGTTPTTSPDKKPPIAGILLILVLLGYVLIKKKVYA